MAEHRCWPSLFGWLGTGGLLLYLIVMHSFHMNDLAELRGALSSQIIKDAQAAVGDTILIERSRFQQALVEWDAQQRRQLDDRLEQADAHLQRATSLSWALQTPDVERDVELKRALEALQTAQHD